MVKATVKADNSPAESDQNASAERMADLNDAEGGELFRAIEEARSTQGAEVILTRTMPADKAGFCDKIPVAEFDLTMVKSKYGPGTYRVRFNGPTGFLPGGSTIKIAATPERPATASTGADSFQSFLELQARRDAERSTKLWELAIISVPALIAGFFNRPQGNDVAALVTALKPAPGPSITDLTSALANMQSLTAPKESNNNMIDTIFKAFEFAKDMSGGEGGGSKEGSNWVDVIRDVIKAAPEAIKPMLEARMAAMQAGQPKVAQLQPAIAPATPSQQNINTQPAPNAAPAESSASVAGNTGGDMRALWEPIAKQHLAKVAGWADKQRDPEIYAEVFVDELPDLSPYLSIDQVLEHLQNPTWFEKICELEPRLKIHHDFCEEMRNTVVEIVKDLKKQAEEENATPPTDGAE